MINNKKRTLTMAASFKKNSCAIAVPLFAALIAPALQAQDAFSSQSDWMLGDWGGLRTQLQEDGYDFNIQYTGEAASNVGGGYSSQVTGRYADQLTLGSHLNLQKILGWDNADFQLTVTERSGRNLTGEGVADPRVGGLSSVQEVYGRGQTWRLTQLWYRQSFFDGAFDVKLGRLGVGEDFGTFSCKFQNLAFCGAQAGDWAGDIIYNWPVSQWGGRAKFALGADTYFQVGVYEQNPSNLENTNAFKLNTSGEKGTLIPVELVHKVTLGADKLPGEYRIGGYYSTAKADDVYLAADGTPEPLSNAGFKSHNNKHGAWWVVQHQVYKDASNAARGLTLFSNATVHDKATNKIDRYIQAGLFYTSPFDSRPNDEIGFGVANIHVNNRFKDLEELENTVSGADDYNDPSFIPPQHSETSMELYYGFQVTKWLTVRPNVQYVVHPGGVNDVDNAWVAGLKFETTL